MTDQGAAQPGTEGDGGESTPVESGVDGGVGKVAADGRGRREQRARHQHRRAGGGDGGRERGVRLRVEPRRGAREPAC